MKRIFISILVLIFTISNSIAIDFGGMLYNITGTKGDTSALTFNQENQVSLWMKLPFNKSNSMGLSMEGMYRFTWNSETKAHNILDIGLFKFHSFFNINSNTQLKLNIGRFRITDITRFIFAQASDGIHISLESSAYSIALYTGYTGLLNSNIVLIHTNTPSTSGYIYSLAPGYIPLNFSFRLPLFFLNQSFSSEVLSFIDPKNEFTRLYMSAGLNGPIIDSLYYIFTTSFGTNIINGKNDLGVSNLTKLELNYFLDFLSSSINMDLIYATGNHGGIKPFLPFTIISVIPKNSDPLLLSGLLKTGITATIKPIDNLFCFVSAHIIINTPGTTASSYAGTQWMANAQWALLSDVNISLSMGQYIPYKGDGNFYLNLKAVLLF